MLPYQPVHPRLNQRLQTGYSYRVNKPGSVTSLIHYRCGTLRCYKCFDRNDSVISIHVLSHIYDILVQAEIRPSCIISIPMLFSHTQSLELHTVLCRNIWTQHIQSACQFYFCFWQCNCLIDHSFTNSFSLLIRIYTKNMNHEYLIVPGLNVPSPPYCQSHDHKMIGLRQSLSWIHVLSPYLFSHYLAKQHNSSFQQKSLFCIADYLFGMASFAVTTVTFYCIPGMFLSTLTYPFPGLSVIHFASL